MSCTSAPSSASDSVKKVLAVAESAGDDDAVKVKIWKMQMS